MIRYLTPLFLLLGFCIAIALCNCDNQICYEKACRPDWASDCYCPPGAHMQMQPDGTVLCVCPIKEKDNGK